MKKILVSALIIASTSSFAQVPAAGAPNAEDLKKMALEACETQMEQVPAEMREKAMKTCKCTVEKTDYEALLAAQKAGDTEKIQADATAAALACAKESL